MPSLRMNTQPRMDQPDSSEWQTVGKPAKTRPAKPSADSSVRAFFQEVLFCAYGGPHNHLYSTRCQGSNLGRGLETGHLHVCSLSNSHQRLNCLLLGAAIAPPARVTVCDSQIDLLLGASTCSQHQPALPLPYSPCCSLHRAVPQHDLSTNLLLTARSCA